MLIGTFRLFFRFSFHSRANEPERGASVVPPLRDDVQLSIEEYRNKLYAMMDEKHRKHKNMWGIVATICSTAWNYWERIIIIRKISKTNILRRFIRRYFVWILCFWKHCRGIFFKFRKKWLFIGQNRGYEDYRNTYEKRRVRVLARVTLLWRRIFIHLPTTYDEKHRRRIKRRRSTKDRWFHLLIIITIRV